MTIYIVTGLGYGDEGKGTTVDFLARQGKSLVIRHNGGPQAGHNVVTPEGRHHEFSQFGSGHFAGADTYLSKHMLVMPGDMRMEARDLEQDHLGDDNPYARMYVDQECRIITPYHVALNRLMAYAHGQSCGRGIGELMRQDIARPDLTITVGDIIHDTYFSGTLYNKLEALRDHLWKESLRITNFDCRSAEYKVLKFGAGYGCKLSATLAGDYHDWANWVTVVDEREFMVNALRVADYEHIIFEGAQGVLLDEWYGFHPYTTWSTTTHTNALAVLKAGGWGGPVTRLGITRAYATRHGAGPFVSEDTSVQFDEPHNVTGDFQGEFRQGHLDMVALKYAIDVCGGIDGLVVTHLDRADEWKVCSGYNSHDFHADAMLVPKDPHNLNRNAKRSEMLKYAVPSYTTERGVSGSGVIAMLSRLAPIAIQSYGPTANDKTVVELGVQSVPV